MPWKKIDPRDMRPEAPRGTVYLIHFSHAIGPAHQLAQHYIGWTDGTVAERVQEHQKGRGARLLEVAVEQGAELLLARVWPDATRHLERKLKNRGGARRICPLCK